MTYVRLRLVIVAVALAIWLAPGSVAAQTTAPGQAEVQALKVELDKTRVEFEAVRQQYDQRLSALEQKLAQLTGAPQQTNAAPSPPVPPAEPSPPPDPVPTGGGSSAFAKIFNPDIAVVGNMLGAAGHNPVEDSPALQLSEAEASFQAIVDPYAKADFFIAVGPDGAELEEGFITFNTLPGRFLLKAGKLRANFGKVNTQHTHALAWTDRPLVTRNLVGGEEGLADGGLSLSRLVLNPWFFLEATGEVFGGRSDLFEGNQRSQLTYVARLRGYRDLTEGSNLDIGTSFAYGHTATGPDTTAQLVGVDATFRYRPLRRAIYSRFQARTELVWSRQDLEDFERSRAFGMYGSAEYQFARRWVGGARYDRSGRALNGDLIDNGGAFTLTFWPSEFSQIRGEYRLTRYADDVTANEFLFQFLFAIGAHGAHVF
ncbi:MAG: hypothetical protein JJE40_05935 [Vicinamibacteria bacterium]|nr:hypothetical protein [Vicinamibacteria bacterium]